MGEKRRFGRKSVHRKVQWSALVTTGLREQIPLELFIYEIGENLLNIF